MRQAEPVRTGVAARAISAKVATLRRGAPFKVQLFSALNRRGIDEARAIIEGWLLHEAGRPFTRQSGGPPVSQSFTPLNTCVSGHPAAPPAARRFHAPAGARNDAHRRRPDLPGAGVLDGNNRTEPVKSMPGVTRYSLDSQQSPNSACRPGSR